MQLSINNLNQDFNYDLIFKPNDRIRIIYPDNDLAKSFKFQLFQKYCLTDLDHIWDKKNASFSHTK